MVSEARGQTDMNLETDGSAVDQRAGQGEMTHGFGNSRALHKQRWLHKKVSEGVGKYYFVFFASLVNIQTDNIGNMYVPK